MNAVKRETASEAAAIATPPPRAVPPSNRRKVEAARLSVLSNTALVALKLGVGVSIGSVSVISEAVHSATDLFAALIAFFAVRASDAPPDEQHPYGHGKFEAVSGVIEALLIFAAGVFIIWQAANALITGRHLLAPLWGVAVMAVSAIVNVFVARHLHAVAKETDSVALLADAHHLSVDVWTSAGVLVGLALVAITGEPRFDAFVALVVAVIVFVTAARLTRDALYPLIDNRLPDNEIALVKGVMATDDRVLGWHKLRTRKSGSERHIDVHIQVDDDMSLREAHRLTEELEDKIRAALPKVVVVIHTEPFEEEQRHHEEQPH